jgi:hypothetical protein
MVKRCSICKLPKDESEYSRRLNGRYLRSACKKCNSLESAKYRSQQDPEELRRKGRRSSIKTEHGITEEDYKNLLDRQGQQCAICHTNADGKRLHIDH